MSVVYSNIWNFVSYWEFEGHAKNQSKSVAQTELANFLHIGYYVDYSAIKYKKIIANLLTIQLIC